MHDTNPARYNCGANVEAIVGVTHGEYRRGESQEFVVGDDNTNNVPRVFKNTAQKYIHQNGTSSEKFKFRRPPRWTLLLAPTEPPGYASVIRRIPVRITPTLALVNGSFPFHFPLFIRTRKLLFLNLIISGQDLMALTADCSAKHSPASTNFGVPHS